MSAPVLADLVPHDPDAEGAVLGAILLDPDALSEVADRLPVEAFYLEQHRAVYGACLELHQRGIAPDLVSLSSHLRAQGQAERAGGAAFLSHLVDVLPDVANVLHYAAIVRDHHDRRRVNDILQAALGSTRTAAELIPSLQARLADLEMAAADDGLQTMGQVVGQAAETIRERHTTGKGDPRQVLTGLTVLDETLIIAPGTQTVLAGDTGSGKSALALQVAEHVAAGGQPVLVASYEMSPQQLAYRSLAARVAPVPRLQRGQLTRDEVAALDKAGAALSDLPVYFLEASGATVAHLALHARRLKARQGLGLLVVDYLQLATPTSRNRTREQEVSEISHGLRAIALQLDVPVLALSQLRRREGGRGPSLSDLRESGALEQDADAVLLIEQDEESDTAILTVAKNRQGPCGRLRIAWDGSRLRFRNIAGTGGPHA